MSVTVHCARPGNQYFADGSPPPPIPARLHHTAGRHRDAAADSGYLAPTHHGRGPPLPPRQPLRRSVSLTHRPPPDPVENGPDHDNDNDQPVRILGDPVRIGREPTLEEVLASLRRSRVDTVRPAHLSPALSAPLLGQVVPVTRWPLPTSSQSGRTTSPVRVVPLSRWPLHDTASVTERLTMDGIVVDRAGGNEYVDAPSAAGSQADPANGGRRRRVGRKTPSPAVRVDHVLLPPPNGSTPETVDDPAELRRRGRGGGLAVKVRRFLSCVGTSPTPSSTSSSGDERDSAAAAAPCGPLSGALCPSASGEGPVGGTLCRRCGRCRCSECVGAAQSSTLRRARSAVDVLSCMCCVSSLFYHCFKDDAGDELDCSDEPCACTDRPHCAARWAVMGALLPCLPCLCLYWPLRCTVDAVCQRPAPGTGLACRCSSRNLRRAGLKGLLESESSSA